MAPAPRLIRLLHVPQSGAQFGQCRPADGEDAVDWGSQLHLPIRAWAPDPQLDDPAQVHRVVAVDSEKALVRAEQPQDLAERACRSAVSYLALSGFSCRGLIDQLSSLVQSLRPVEDDEHASVRLQTT